MKLTLPNTTFLLPPSNPIFHHNTSLHTPNSPKPLTFLQIHSLNSLQRFRCRPNPNSKVSGVAAVETGEFGEIEEAESVLETCIMRTLPPALTLEQGLHKIKEAVDLLKLDPPSSRSGIVRIQVVVPPSAKSLNWLCCQPLSSTVFPQFFLSKEKGNPTSKPLSLNGLRGVFGIGAAVHMNLSSSSTASGNWRSFKRFLSFNSPLVTAYGFMDISFDIQSYSMNHQTGSYYILIPQIELDEHGGISTLAATLAWGDSSVCTFKEAVDSFELSLYKSSFIACHREFPWEIYKICTLEVQFGG